MDNIKDLLTVWKTGRNLMVFEKRGMDEHFRLIQQ